MRQDGHDPSVREVGERLATRVPHVNFVNNDMRQALARPAGPCASHGAVPLLNQPGRAGLRHSSPASAVSCSRSVVTRQNHADKRDQAAMHYIADHYRFVLTYVFERSSFAHAILVEEDMVLSPDFLTLFEATAPLLDADPSLYCVSSWSRP